MQNWLSPAAIGWVIAASLAIGWWACTVTARHMRVLDPGSIVWDEVVGLLDRAVAGDAGRLAGASRSPSLLFRFFDAVKPGPVAWADGLFHGFGWRGGFGIIFDDLVAAFCTLLVIAALEVLVHERRTTQLARSWPRCCWTGAGCWPPPRAAPAA